jgi:peptidyl-prolyl cis-trans isomerase A (cyclophilin A)
MTDPSLLHPATLKAKAPDTYEVTFTTTRGDFVVRVTRAWAPLGADRFYNLVKHHFYNGAAFFRVVPNFMVQFGLSPDPAVNRAWMNADIKDDPVSQSNRPGYITFATAGPNTRTTQVFINYGNNAFLDGQGFAPFGQVISGMDVVTQIYGGYGENPDQGQITSHGRTYLEKNFPKLDTIKTAVVTSPASPAGTTHHATSSTPKSD